MKRQPLALALGLTLLAGCASLPPFFGAPSALVANGNATLKLSAEVTPGGYRPLATVNPYVPADIHHVTLTVLKLDASTEVPLQDAQRNPLAVKLSQAQLGREVAIAKLWPDTTYRIKARAYADADETLPISKGGASDQIDVVVTNDDRPTVARIKVSLSDRTFDGTATASVTFTPGTLNTAGTPTVSAPFVVSTLAGSTQGTTDATGTAAKFANPAGVALDASGNLYVADTSSHRIRKVTPQGVVTTFAGSTLGYLDGTGTAAQFRQPSGVDVDASGNVYVAEYGNHRIRKITPAGVVTTLAGSGGAGTADGTGTAAKFNAPAGLALDASGNVFVADTTSHRIRMVTPAGVVTTFAGSTSGYTDGTGTAAKFNAPRDLAIDAEGNLFVADSGNNRIRKITPQGVVTTFAGSTLGNTDGTGTAAQFNNPFGIDMDAEGNFFVTDLSSHRIRKVTPAGVVTTVAGSTAGFADATGTGTAAKFSNPYGIVVDPSGNLYIGDFTNNRIRKIDP